MKRTGILVTLACVFILTIQVFGGRIITSSPSPGGFPALIPRVQRSESNGEVFALPEVFTISAPNGDDLGIEGLTAELKNRFPDIRVLQTADPDSATCRLVLKSADVPKNTQGYRMTIGKDGIEIAGRTSAGLFYGVQTLRNIIRNVDDSRLPGGIITDWPDLEMRGILFNLRGLNSRDVEKFNRSVERLAALKINYLRLEFAENLPIADNPFTRRKNFLTADDIACIVDTCRKNHIEIVPAVQALSHCQWLKTHPDFYRMIEGEMHTLHSPWFVSACPQNEEAYDLTMLVISTAVKLLKPRYIHVGLDEIFIGNSGQGVQCPKCRGKDLYELIKTYVLRLEKDIYDLGVVPMINVDSFYPKRFWHYDFFKALKCDPRLDRIVDELDRRDVIDYWNYNPRAREDIALYYSEELGFRLIGSSYCRHPLNAETMPRLIRKIGGRGCLLTYWSHVDHRIFNAPEVVGNYALAATAVSADNSWNTSTDTIIELDYDPVHEVRKIFAPDTPRRFRLEPGQEIPLDRCLNAEFGGNPEFPCFSPETLGELQRQLADGTEHFRVITDGNRRYYGVALNGGDGIDSFPDEEVSIPVGRRFSGLSFLMTSGRPNGLNSRTPEGSSHYIPKPPVGRLTVHYVDETEAHIPLTWRGSLVDWNAQASAWGCRFVWRGRDRRGAVCNFVAVDWDNPYPDKEIKHIEFASSGYRAVAPVLLAISGFGPGDGGTYSNLTDREAIQAGSGKITSGMRPPAFVPVAEFTSGRMGGATLNYERGKHTGEVRHAFETAPDYSGRKMLKVVVPGLKEGEDMQRFYVDVPLPEGVKNFRSVIADCRIEHPEFVVRNSMYVRSGNPDSGCEALFEVYHPEKDRWVTLYMAREMAAKEAGGVVPGSEKALRLSFWLCNPEPMSICIGRFGISPDRVGCRRALFDGEYRDMWYHDRERDIIERNKNGLQIAVGRNF